MMCEDRLSISFTAYLEMIDNELRIYEIAERTIQENGQGGSETWPWYDAMIEIMKILEGSTSDEQN